MGMVILRVKKLKSAGGVSGYAAHNTRERPTDHAKADLKSQNSHLAGEGAFRQVMSLWRERVAKDEKPRKNAVVALDYMIHASPKALTPAAREAYLKDALAWVVKRHGRENIVQASIHRDENTEPHLHVIVVPLLRHEGQRNNGKMKLNAGHWLDGRKKLSAMQTEFALEVGKKYGLERGIEGSTAKHQEVQKFYGLVSQPYREIRVEVSRPPKLGAIMDLDDWKAKEEARITKAVAPIYKRVQAQERETVLLRKKATDLEASTAQLTHDRDAYKKGYEDWHKAAMTMPLEKLIAMREAEKAKEIVQRERKAKSRDQGELGF